ncbi:MAG: hypothetical protein IAE95_07300 [Chitinophagaceae bacterium]|nr:hypothetical protein [Chitinophagaceae bacterium]
MSDKLKKAERSYVLSDSSVNEYGFRLLTSGYEIESFRKNPIGYYMHKREDGIVLKWEDLRVEGDQVLGVPVINLANARGEQTLQEAENGFLNAASVGHIVVLEYSLDKELMLPGQTGPTITRWYNKECSLVDIPGNCNALTQLYDANENELNLADMGGSRQMYPMGNHELLATMATHLKMEKTSDVHQIGKAVERLAQKATQLEAENQLLYEERARLTATLDEIQASRKKAEVQSLLVRALEDKKVTVELRDRLATDYAGNPDGLRTLIAAMPAYRSIAEQLSQPKQEGNMADWTWDDYERNDPSGKKLMELRATDAAKYQELFNGKFNA